MTLRAGCTAGETMKTKIGDMRGGTGGEKETRSCFMCFEMSWPRATPSFEKCTTVVADSAFF